MRQCLRILAICTVTLAATDGFAVECPDPVAFFNEILDDKCLAAPVEDELRTVMNGDSETKRMGE